MSSTNKSVGIVLIIIGVMTVFNILVDLAFWRVVAGILILVAGLFFTFNRQPETPVEKTASKDYPEEHSHVLCEACNSALPESSAYCSKCGAKI